MVNTKLTSLKRIISKIYSDMGITEENVPISDIIEWSAEALEKIEAPTLMYEKVTGKEGVPLTIVTDYQAKLPLDCIKVNQIAYADNYNSTQFYPMKYATGSFSGRHQLTSQMNNQYYNSNPVNNISSNYSVISLAMDLFNLTYEEALTKLNNEPDTKSTLSSLLSTQNKLLSTEGGTVSVDKLEYKLVPGYIKTNVKEGYLMVSYLSLPTDEEGLPLIPDHPSFIDAIYWYVNMKISYINYRTNPNSATKALYEDAAREWRFYVKQAYGKAMMPSNVDELESLKDQWLRLYPKTNEHKTFFKNLNSQQRLENHTSIYHYG